MSDHYFDALGDAGEYPPKGYGWVSDEEKRKRVINLLKRGINDPWMKPEIQRLQIEEYEYSN